MNFDFKIYQLKETSRQAKTLLNDNRPNTFIIVGEEKQYYRAHQIDERGLVLIPGISIKEFSLYIPKEDLELARYEWNSIEIHQFDIPKSYLTMDIIADIERLNED